MSLTAGWRYPGRFARNAARARAAFIALRGESAADERAAQIEALPVVEWNGSILHTVTCQAAYGRGPHALNVPAGVLWALIDIRHFRCPWHP